MDLTASALGLDPARASDPAAFAIAESIPRVALRPADADEVCEALRAANRDRLALVPWGGGLGLAQMAAPGRYDVALDLRSLDRVLAYEPADLTVTAECGVTLDSLAARLAARGQELPLEPPMLARATLGGTLAANATGPRRLRLGSPRDRILGARFALADGTSARSGGRVVKNVAGYGIHRLLCGSHGALAVVLEATLKLLPAPRSRTVLAWSVGADAFADASRWAALPRIEPAWWTVLGAAHAQVLGDGAGGAFQVLLGLEDDAPWVARQIELASAALGPPRARVEGEEAIALRRRVSDLDALPHATATAARSPAPAPATTRAPWLRFVSAHNSPAALAPLVREPESPSLVFHACGGHLGLTAERARAQDLIATAGNAGFSLVEASGLESIEPLIPPQSGVATLRRRILTELDPRGTFAMGGRWGG